MRIGRLSRLWPWRRGAADCLRCRTSFYFERGRVTVAESPLLPDAFAIVAVCAHCWRELSPPDRLPYYQRRWLEVRGPNPRENELRWAAIVAAVMAGA